MKKIWNLQVPLEAYLKQLEDIYELALALAPAYTEAKMIGKAITSVEQCGLFPTALLEWDGFTQQIRIGKTSRPTLGMRISF